jgi:DNA-binding transcriptional LysR family regulator
MNLDLADLKLLSTVARHLSFRMAAQELGLSASAVSHAVRSIEERLGVRMFSRTTRSVALTPAGRQLLDRVGPALQDIAAAIDGINEFRDTPQGLLRINAPRPAGELVLGPLVAQFLARHPKAEVELVLDDGFVDIVEGGFDAGVRYGESLQQDMVALPLGPPQRLMVVGAPSLLARAGTPRTPHDLLALPCVRIRFPSGARYAWEFEKAGEKLAVNVEGRLTVGEMPLMLQAALAGVGFAYVYEPYARADLNSGALVSVLDDWCPPIPGFYLYYPSRKLPTATLAAFLEMVKAAQWAD